MTNPQLTNRLQAILLGHGLASCGQKSKLGSGPDLPRCAIHNWIGNPTRIEPGLALIETGYFSTPAKNIAGHRARFRRVSDETLEIVVKGVGHYLSNIPNADVAQQISVIIEETL